MGERVSAARRKGLGVVIFWGGEVRKCRYQNKGFGKSSWDEIKCVGECLMC